MHVPALYNEISFTSQTDGGVAEMKGNERRLFSFALRRKRKRKVGSIKSKIIRISTPSDDAHEYVPILWMKTFAIVPRMQEIPSLSHEKLFQSTFFLCIENYFHIIHGILCRRFSLSELSKAFSVLFRLDFDDSFSQLNPSSLLPLCA